MKARTFIYDSKERSLVCANFKSHCRKLLQLRNEWHSVSDALTKCANDVVNEGIQALYVDPQANEYVGANRAVYLELTAAHERRRETLLKRCVALLNQLQLLTTQIHENSMQRTGAAESMVKLECGGTVSYYESLLSELASCYEREMAIKSLIVGDLAVAEQVETLTIYLLALLTEVRLADVPSVVDKLQSMLN